MLALGYIKQDGTMGVLRAQTFAAWLYFWLQLRGRQHTVYALEQMVQQ